MTAENDPGRSIFRVTSPILRIPTTESWSGSSTSTESVKTFLTVRSADVTWIVGGRLSGGTVPFWGSRDQRKRVCHSQSASQGAGKGGIAGRTDALSEVTSNAIWDDEAAANRAGDTAVAASPQGAAVRS